MRRQRFVRSRLVPVGLLEDAVRSQPLVPLCVLALAIVLGFARHGSAQSVAQQAYLKAFNTDAGDQSRDVYVRAEPSALVAVSGDTVVVGMPFESSNSTGVNGPDNNVFDASGAAYVFVRTGSTWSQQAYLKASNTGRNDNFGWSVAISGDTVVIGAPFEDSSATGVNGNPADTGAFASGAAYVFTRSDGTWTQQAYLKASNTGVYDRFGWSVAVSGDTVVVGAPFESSSSTGVDGADNDAAQFSGAAYVFVRSGPIWGQQAYLKASNTGADDRFGMSVAVSGDTAVVGALNEDGPNNNMEDSGAAYVFLRSESAWSQQAYLKASNIQPFALFGISVAISGESVLVGAPVVSYPDKPFAGAADLFVRSDGQWTFEEELSRRCDLLAAGGRFGWAVALSGDIAVVGTIFDWSDATGIDGLHNTLAPYAGAAYMFPRNSGAGFQLVYVKPFNTGSGDLFGWSVAASGTTFVVDAPGEDSSATGVDGPDNDLALQSGAAYVFTLSTLSTPPTITPMGVTRQQGTSGGASIATVSDGADPPGLLAVSVQSANPFHGVTVSSLANSYGSVAANVEASCTATSASFTLRVTDSANAFTDGTLPVTVTPSLPVASAAVGTVALWPPDHRLINVGLVASATGTCAPAVQVLVFSNEDDLTPGDGHSPDAKDLASGTLRLRSERMEGGPGRVYLIVVRATNTSGHLGVAVATVVVPAGHSAAELNAVTAMAAAAQAYALANNGTAPPGYAVVGDGPVVGPRQ